MRKENVKKIKQLIHERIKMQEHLSEISHFLLSKGISKTVADEVIQELQKRREGEGMKAWLELLNDSLSAKIKTTSGFIFSKPSKRIAIVGPTGVGKTTLILKLASAFKDEKKVGVLSFEKENGALEKTVVQWGIPLANFNEIEELSDRELILIDTSGCNSYESSRVDEMGAQLASLGDVEVHLALSAVSKDVDLYGAIHQFSTLDLASLIFTKLDETLASGVLLNVSSRVDIPISYIAYGYPLPGKIERADPKEIIHKILTDLNDDKFNFLRQLASH